MAYRSWSLVVLISVANGIGSVRAAEPLKEKATLQGHAGDVLSLAFSPDGKTLASGSGDETIRLWEVASGKNTGTLKTGGFSTCSLAFSPDGKTLASGDRGNRVRLWSLADGKCTKLRDDISMAGDAMVLFSRDGKTLAAGGRHDGEVWDTDTGRSRATLKEYEKFDVDRTKTIALMPDGKTLISMGAYNGIKHWDLATGKMKAEQTIPEVSFGVFSPDCKTLATVRWEKSKKVLIQFWDVATGKEQAAIKGPIHDVLALVFTPDGKTLASGSVDGTIKLWDVASGNCLASILAHESFVRCLAFSPDGTMLASGSEDTTIKLWEVNFKR